MVMGHSLGEYGALVAAEVLTFAEALEAAAARGREMSRVSFGDNGAMAAVMAPAELRGRGAEGRSTATSCPPTSTPAARW